MSEVNIGLGLLLLLVSMSILRKKNFENAMNLTSSTTVCFSDFAPFVFQQTTNYLKMQILQNQEWFNWKYKLLIFNRFVETTLHFFQYFLLCGISFWKLTTITHLPIPPSPWKKLWSALHQMSIARPVLFKNAQEMIFTLLQITIWVAQ